ncbi:hypothetical protein [Bergeyella zoohelcum]|uniref:Signal peptidase n=1 Tax=Bergeyella zoohelcum ATCC 43767 TaxID=883096 RepID=K1MBI3_9FLAO|nr:hypothetical protein [Bergeyella zoohelcum]EKB59728.1 hypothetical protein HMPREF9699_00093 [Bergeyella zoohelcum ATCC 43767]SUV49729.1 Uncharacterised protein [Bergeyella zoohelcum]
MKKILAIGLLFMAHLMLVFGQGGSAPGNNPPTPEEGPGGAGGTAPGHRVVDIDMYIPLLIIVAVMLVLFYTYTYKKRSLTE